MKNYINVVGRIGHHPEYKQASTGKSVTTFSVACDRDYYKDSEKQTDWFDCVAWGKTAEFISNNFTKGDMIDISGRLETRKYEDKNGNNRTAYEIRVDMAYFCGFKKDKETPKPNMDVVVDDTDLKEIPTEDDLPF